jgi:nucleoside-diphosphate-sugar epimerase
MITMAETPVTDGEVFNISGEAVDVNRYIAVLAEVVGAEPDVVYLPDAMLPELTEPGAPPVFGHLFKVRHHAALSTAKAERMLGFRPRYDLRSGHAHTFEWFLAQGYDRLTAPLADPVWKVSWDFEAERAVAGWVRDGR